MFLNRGVSQGRKAQASPEFMAVASFVLLVFLVVAIISMQKQAEVFKIQVFLDAKKVASTVGDNINMMSKSGPGYYRYFNIPTTLHGYTDYNISIVRNLLEISFDSSNYELPLLTSNISVLHLGKGYSETNCIQNAGGMIVINDVCGLSDQGCGSVQSCDSGDVDTCPTCYSPEPVLINQNSISYCPSYGCSTEEWHIYRVIPTSDGTIRVSFSGTGTMPGSRKTDLIFYDYNQTGCSSPQRLFDLEPESYSDFAVVSGRAYVIALDVDAADCSEGGSYQLWTELK
jgi:hypothetical protein